MTSTTRHHMWAWRSLAREAIARKATSARRASFTSWLDELARQASSSSQLHRLNSTLASLKTFSFTNIDC